MKSSYIFLNSDDADGSSYDADFNLNFNTADHTATGISLISCCFNNSVYPFQGGNNNNLTVVENVASTLSITITPNNYSGTELASFLQSALNTASVAPYVYTVSYSNQSKKLTFSSTNTFYISSASTCLNELGCVAGSSLVSSVVGSYPVNLAGTKYVDIISSLSTNNNSSNNYTNILARIPLDSSFGSVIVWENPQATPINLYSGVQHINLRVFDEWGREFLLPNNVSIAYTFALQYEM